MNTLRPHLSRCRTAAGVMAAGVLLYTAAAPGSGAEQGAFRERPGGGAAARDRPCRPASSRPARSPAAARSMPPEAGRPTAWTTAATTTAMTARAYGPGSAGGYASRASCTASTATPWSPPATLLRQADLTASRSFHGLTLRGLDFPAAHHFTVDFVPDEATGDHRFLMLWHFRPPAGRTPEMLPHGQLPLLADLPERFSIFACDGYPDLFCPAWDATTPTCRDRQGGCRTLPATMA